MAKKKKTPVITDKEQSILDESVNKEESVTEDTTDIDVSKEKKSEQGKSDTDKTVDSKKKKNVIVRFKLVRGLIWKPKVTGYPDFEGINALAGNPTVSVNMKDELLFKTCMNAVRVSVLSIIDEDDTTTPEVTVTKRTDYATGNKIRTKSKTLDIKMKELLINTPDMEKCIKIIQGMSNLNELETLVDLEREGSNPNGVRREPLIAAIKNRILTLRAKHPYYGRNTNTLPERPNKST